MERILRYLVIPSVLPLAFFLVTLAPMEQLPGSWNRGLASASIALFGALLGLGAATLGVRAKGRAESGTAWWMASAAILSIPAVVIAFAP